MKKPKTQKPAKPAKAKARPSSPPPLKVLADCRRARHDYFILETFTAGMSLQGWEVKAARAGRAQINEAHVRPVRGEMFLLGSHFTPLVSAGTHKEPDPARSRKLLLHAKEISRIGGKVQRAGLTLVPLQMHLARGKIKLSLALARGKKKHDRREALKEKDWQRQQRRILSTKIKTRR